MRMGQKCLLLKQEALFKLVTGWKIERFNQIHLLSIIRIYVTTIDISSSDFEPKRNHFGWSGNVNHIKRNNIGPKHLTKWSMYCCCCLEK